jgi:phosphatidylserine decarboxylase
MRIPLTRHGLRELLLFGALPGLAGVGLLLFGPWAAAPWVAAPLLLLALFVCSFFRDPDRTPPGPAEAAVAPADGKVTDIEEVDEPEFIGGRALRIGIFLSEFDVHVNRAPLDGKVALIRYQPGVFLDARHPDCKLRNEANLVGFEGARGRFVVRQVAGLIARRIVCPLQAGQELRRGERMGMIKFGSRTELYVPAGQAVRVEVEVGQTVKGALTILFRYEA